MRKLNRFTIIAASVATLLTASAGAAQLEEYEVLLKASVPSDDFHVRPVESGWIGEPQEMVYDPGTQKLQQVKKMFQYKNTAGAIKATLLNTNDNNSPMLFSGKNSIPLEVKFNNISVNTEGAVVATIAEAKEGGRANLNISTLDDKPLSPETFSGEYTGSVSINFEPVITGS